MQKKHRNDFVQSARIAAELFAQRAKLIEEFIEHLSAIDEQIGVCVGPEFVPKADSSPNRRNRIRSHRSS